MDYTVFCPGNGQTITEITIRASDIKDLVEAPNENAHPPPAQEPEPQVPKQPFVDPAIIGMSKRPQIPAAPLPQALPLQQAVPRVQEVRRLSARTVSAAGPSQDALLDAVEALTVGAKEEATEAELQAIQNKKTRSRRRRGKLPRDPEAMEEAAIPYEAPAAQVPKKSQTKGWRQTPMLEPNPSFQPFATLRKSKGKTNENGWQTEDATDVQELGEFDFESNLSKFDKRTVFEGIRAEDVTADEDRLVGHNRRPGTNGGKNLHPSENVLDGVNTKAAWQVGADDSENVVEAIRGSQRDTGSGRTSRRGNSKLRKPPTRKESGTAGIPQSFYTVSGNKHCDVISALQMLNLENIADSEFGLSEDMMSENAGRGIAELAKALTNNRGRSLAGDVVGKAAYVVILAGNNKSGLRAVAAGRQMRNRGMNVVVCVLGLDREAELLVGLRRQIKVFRSFGGRVFNKIELMDYVKNIDTPVDLILDGLLGLTMAFEELRTGDQAAAYELIEWANRSEAEVMAIDIPTGIDPSSGKVSIIDGRPLYMLPNCVVAMGAPKKGLLLTMSLGEGIGSPDSWRIWVADIGIASLAWKKAGTRMRKGVEFEKGWTFEIVLKVGVE